MTVRNDFTIKSALVILVTICIVPASLIAVTLLYYDYFRAQDSRIDSSITTARTIVYSVDKEFSNTEATLRALATSPSLTSGDLVAFFHQASEIQKRGQVRNIVLSDPSGKKLINTSHPFGEELSAIKDQTHLRLLADTDGPVISALAKDAITNELLTVISVPVRRRDEHVYNLSANISPVQFSRLLQKQQLPSDWIVSVVDSDAVLVARTHQISRFLGKKAAPDLLYALSFDNQGSFEGQTSEGIPVLGVFSRSEISNWSVAIGIPLASLTEELRTKVGWLAFAIFVLLIASLGMASFIATRIAQSVRGLRAPALALGQGKQVIIPSLQLREANQVGVALREAAVMLQNAKHQATHDVLTGLPNRAVFNDLVGRQIAVSERAGTHFSVLFIDLDGFKPVNDIHGHAAGDKILCEVSKRLRGELRESDMAARFGGDEFAVILVGTPTSQAKKVADKLGTTLSAAYDFEGRAISISASIGLAGYPDAGVTDHELLRMADQAMYQAKAAGKGQVICAGKAGLPVPMHRR